MSESAVSDRLAVVQRLLRWRSLMGQFYRDSPCCERDYSHFN